MFWLNIAADCVVFCVLENIAVTQQRCSADLRTSRIARHGEKNTDGYNGGVKLPANDSALVGSGLPLARACVKP